MKHQNKVKNYKRDINWENYWSMYARGWISITDIKNMMREKYVSNKAYDKYDLFIPNNLK